MKIIYLGPSGYKIDNKGLLNGWLVKPPCKQADIMNDIQQYKPKKICIVDGLYKTIPAPWHKELLLALENNVVVDGVGSLGALRAAELDEYGMNGYGWIYNFIKANEPTDDSIVALLHMDAASDYKPITVAKVELIHLFLSYSSITDEQIKIDISQELIDQIMHINFEKLSKKFSASILEKLDPEVDWLQHLLGDNYSIKSQDTINYLEQEYSEDLNSSKSFTLLETVERTNYIFRQKHLDLSSTNAYDLSDLNYTLQLYSSYSSPCFYDISALEIHFLLLCRLIVELNIDTLKNINIDWIADLYNDNAWRRDSLGLNMINIGVYHNILPELLSRYQSKVFELKDDEWLMYHNLYAALEIYGHCKTIDSETEKASRNAFIGCLILTAIYESINCNESTFILDQHANLELNDKYKMLVDMHCSFLELVKCTPIVGSHGGIAVQQKLKNNNDLIKSYKTSIQALAQSKPFALYSDTYSQQKRTNLLQNIQVLNLSRILESSPTHCIGSHFYNFHHWLLMLEELVDD